MFVFCGQLCVLRLQLRVLQRATVAECTVLVVVTVALRHCYCDWSDVVLCATNAIAPAY